MSSPSYTCVAAIVLFSISAVRLAAQIAGAACIILGVICLSSSKAQEPHA